MGWIKKAYNKAENKVEGVVSKQLVQRVGAVVAPITLLPALVNKSYRKNTGPIYAGYAAVGAGAVGAAYAGLGSGAIFAAGAAPATTLGVNALTSAGRKAGGVLAAATDFLFGAAPEAPIVPDSGGSSGDTGGLFSSPSSTGSRGTPPWLYAAGAVLVGLLAMLLYKRLK